MTIRRVNFAIAMTGIFMILIGGYMEYNIYQQEEDFYNTTKSSYYKLFNKKNLPEDKLSLSKIEEIERNIEKIDRHEKEKIKLSSGIKEIKNYYLLKEQINDNFPNKVLNSSVDSNIIKGIEQKYNKLPKKYQKNFEEDIKEMKNQRNYIDSIELEIDGLFLDNKKTNLKENITREQIENSRQKLSLLKQQDLIKNKNEELNIAINIINKREEETRKKREEEIRKAWVVLNVPYISQNHNNVLNGCEAASLLMGLQYKGYLKSMTLQQYAIDMPKSENNNAYEGFTHDIFGLEPRSVPHWIAPNALAEFGRKSSNNPNIIDGTGYSLDDLDNEISNNNPVVIYATGNFKRPKEWLEGAPKNIHILLLTGYNKITKEQIITDPWTQSNGKTKWYLSKNELEPIYNAVGKKSVIIR